MDYFTIWLEDNRPSAKLEALHVKSVLGEYTPATTPEDVIGELEELASAGLLTDFAVNVLLIIDIMLDGITTVDLSDGASVDTGNGYNAGFVFIDNRIRTSDSPFKKATVLFLTEREDDSKLSDLVDRLLDTGAPKPRVFTKGADHDIVKFKAIVNEIAQRREADGD